MKKYVVSSLLALSLVLVAGSAMATGLMDYSAIATGAQTEVSTALTAAVPVIAILIGVTLGYKFIRRFFK